MRITHPERLKQILEEYYDILEMNYRRIEIFDNNPNKPVDEKVIETFFTPNVCAEIFGYSAKERSSRPQQKMDLAVTKQTYHVWKDQKFFDISPQLVEKLKETSTKDIDTYFVRAPYRSMYINLPVGNELYITNNGIKHELNAVYLLFKENEAPQQRGIIRTNTIIDNITKEISVMFWGREKELYGDAIMFSDLVLTEGKISKSIELNINILENPDIMSELFDLFNFIVKLLLYINCSNASIKNIAGFNLEKKLSGMKNPGKKRKLIKRYSQESLKSHDYIDITINHGSENTRSGFSDIIGTNKTKSLEYVRPHFKVQNYGTQNSKSRIIWIDPYTRGEGSENFRIKKIYKVR